MAHTTQLFLGTTSHRVQTESHDELSFKFSLLPFEIDELNFEILTSKKKSSWTSKKKSSWKKSSQKRKLPCQEVFATIYKMYNDTWYHYITLAVPQWCFYMLCSVHTQYTHQLIKTIRLHADAFMLPRKQITDNAILGTTSPPNWTSLQTFLQL